MNENMCIVKECNNNTIPCCRLREAEQPLPPLFTLKREKVGEEGGEERLAFSPAFILQNWKGWSRSSSYFS